MSANKIRITIDREKCIGSGNCVFNADGVFEQDEDGIAEVVDPSAQSLETVQFAVSSCPVNAITMENL
jgi:ferredoxin